MPQYHSTNTSAVTFMKILTTSIKAMFGHIYNEHYNCFAFATVATKETRASQVAFILSGQT